MKHSKDEKHMEKEIAASYPSTQEEANKVGNINEIHSQVHRSLNVCGEDRRHERISSGHVLS